MQGGAPSSPTFRRMMMIFGVCVTVGFAYLLRGVLVPLFLAFLLAYALDPFVERCEKLGIPRALGAIFVMLAIATLFMFAVVFGIPLLLEELRIAAADFPEQLKMLETRVEPWLWASFHVKLPHTMNEVGKMLGTSFASEQDAILNTAARALFGTLSYVAVVLSALIVPVFGLYLLIDFDRIVRRVGDLVPRRWHAPVAEVSHQIHRTLGGYVRGQLTANIVLAALYAAGLRFVADIRLAVVIGVFTGMMAFVPYVGFATEALGRHGHGDARLARRRAAHRRRRRHGRSADARRPRHHAAHRRPLGGARAARGPRHDDGRRVPLRLPRRHARRPAQARSA